MKPLQIAKRWAEDHPEYSGFLDVEAQTRRGKNGRLGTKKTRYTYIVSGGKATRSVYRYKNKIGNGICDVTGKVHHKKELAYYHLPHPRKGERPYADSDVVYHTGWLFTSQYVALQKGAIPGQDDGTTSFDGFYNEPHPEHKNQLVAWEKRQIITI